MPAAGEAERRRIASLDRESLVEIQLEKLNALLSSILPDNAFYSEKLAGVTLPIASLDEFHKLPFTTKDDLKTEDESGQPANLTWPIERYVRFHQTSGTHGRPLAVYDTADDWQWWIECWQYVLDAAGVTANDRALLAFSFGPFIGFWSAHSALEARGALVLPGGGMSTAARLELAARTCATVLFATPTYALRMAEVAKDEGFDVGRLAVRTIIVAGEPGGSAPGIRDAVEAAWQAKVIDHAGASEVGPWGYADASRRGLHILESEFLAEFVSVEHGKSASAGELARLVITPLRRFGMPVVRYDTGDLVRPFWPNDGADRTVLLEGGVLGRADDMMIIRGVNIFPSSVEEILRSFPDVQEFRLTARTAGAMDKLTVEVEDRSQDPARIARELELRLGLTVDVQLAPAESLPRFEGKARRFVDERDGRTVY
ncbi:phenylacetate--CoA ligase family protein [Pirellulales bacterium]|nr:phenylacetate--CoA ligase family protein [Pirellulales bacterium]